MAHQKFMSPLIIRAILPLAAILSIGLTSSDSFAGWLIYHKPAFEGKVIDAETKEPIEGAVVVAIYNKTLMSLGAGTNSYEIHVRETLTDKDGYFRIPSYSTIIQPFSWEDSATFIIYKPGYGSFPSHQSYPPVLERGAQESYFTIGLGVESEFKRGIGAYQFVKLTAGIVELPSLHTKKERLRTIPGTPTFTKSKDLPALYGLINEEYAHFGLSPVSRK